MECNKEEALRAKGIAESKMQSGDFVGARDFMLKAQKLFPNMENISQMLTVCEVHCSAQIKVNGEIDWCRILQVESTADELSIKKQYRKLALLLHPDKNNFTGADAAFVLIGEAHRKLLDQAKRSLHSFRPSNIGNVQTTKCTNQSKRSFRPSNIGKGQTSKCTKQSKRTSFAKRQPGVSSNTAKNIFTQFNVLNQQKSSFADPPTFWTMCTYCRTRYQYYRAVMNTQLQCQTCRNAYIAIDLNAQGGPLPVNLSYSWNHSRVTQEVFPGSAPGAHGSGMESCHRCSSSDIRSHAYVDVGSAELQSTSRFKDVTELGGESTNKIAEGSDTSKGFWTCNGVKLEKVTLEENEKECVGKGNVRNGNTTLRESSDAMCNDGEDIVIQESNCAGQTVGTSGNSQISSRQNKNVSHNEHGNNHELFSPKSKRLKKGTSSNNMVQSGDLSSIGGNASNNFGSVNNEDDKQIEGTLEEVLHGENEQMNKNKMHESGGQVLREKKESSDVGTSSVKHGFDSSSRMSPDADSLSYPVTDFYEFESQRDVNQFAANQIWALYDDFDGMPRYYARIRKVYGPDFKLHFTWLELSPRNKDELAWLTKELPIACGNFKLGKSEYSENRLMFSNRVPWGKGAKKSSYDIYPRKGEVWALFKEWDIRWNSDADTHRLHNYEAVEVLSDYSETCEFTVVPLVKIQGFVSLFLRAVDKRNILLIPHHEILRFSHMIPSYKMTGEGSDGIPKDLFELDSASLPSNYRETFPSIKLENTHMKVKDLDNLKAKLYLQSTKNDKIPSTASLRKGNEMSDEKIQKKKCNVKDLAGEMGGPDVRESSCASEHAAAGAREHVKKAILTPRQEINEKARDVDIHNVKDNIDSEQHFTSPKLCTGPITFTYPDSEFHNFEGERSIEKFQRGQVWALYSDINKFPNYYGCIKKVNLEESKVRVAWLDACPLKEIERQWWDEQLPVVCGIFQIANDSCVFDTTTTFSHLVRAKPTRMKNHYEIYPIIGEVWAVFKNWNSGWTISDIKNCEYEVVEVHICSGSGFELLVLEKVNGYTAVFRPKSTGVAKMEIPLNELLRFSHRIPAFQLTNEGGGKLRGYWELDSASLPDAC